MVYDKSMEILFWEPVHYANYDWLEQCLGSLARLGRKESRERTEGKPILSPWPSDISDIIPSSVRERGKLERVVVAARRPRKVGVDLRLRRRTLILTRPSSPYFCSCVGFGNLEIYL
jgi:hypothetical protein